MGGDRRFGNCHPPLGIPATRDEPGEINPQLQPPQLHRLRRALAPGREREHAAHDAAAGIVAGSATLSIASRNRPREVRV
jgi:hypothetical protein